jgi:hypothetical protein
MQRTRRAVFASLAWMAVCFGSAWLVQAASDDAPPRTSFGTFEFVIPAKWSRAKPDRTKTAAMLLLNGTVWNKSDGMIMVDVGKPAAPSAKELAQALAGKDGKVHADPVQVDGSEGIKVETTSQDLSRPKYAVVVFRDEKVYLIMAAQMPGTNVSQALDQVIKSWKWRKHN